MLMLSPRGGIGALVFSCRDHSVEKPLVGKRQLRASLPGDAGYDGIGPALVLNAACSGSEKLMSSVP